MDEYFCIAQLNKTLHTVRAGFPVFLTEANMNFFDTTENLTARVEIYQASFILFRVISSQN